MNKIVFFLLSLSLFNNCFATESILRLGQRSSIKYNIYACYNIDAVDNVVNSQHEGKFKIARMWSAAYIQHGVCKKIIGVFLTPSKIHRTVIIYRGESEYMILVVSVLINKIEYYAVLPAESFGMIQS